MHVEDLLEAMGSGREQRADEIEAFVAAVVGGEMSRPQAAAWLAWAFARGLTVPETVALTTAMTRSGHVMTWPDGPTLIDKHSTGGVGDKVSLVLAPLWAELGARVPMISGRGLGLTGGTLDKLEAIPGYRCDLDDSELRSQLASVGCFISGQTGELAPADRILYGLRNETGTVASIPLIVASILSKKVAEGTNTLVLDVKCGSGAFMRDLDRATALARMLVKVATGAGLECRALITAMDRPLGQAVGNALEVREAVACLQGGGPDDLRRLVLALAGHKRAEKVLDSGAAYERFCRMVAGQGGDANALETGALLGGGVAALHVFAPHAGWVSRVDAGGIGRAAFLLGAGRRRAEDPVDFGVGLEVFVAPGDRVEQGQPLFTLHHRDDRGVDEALALARDAVGIGEEPVEAGPLILARVER